MYLIYLHFVQLIEGIAFIECLIELDSQFLYLRLELSLLLLQRFQLNAKLLVLRLLFLLCGPICKYMMYITSL